MADSLMKRCGGNCETCSYREKTGCPGCLTAEGKAFWGECALATCCIAKGPEHCGQCKDFPCATLNEYSYSSEHGDNGKRIRILEEWNEKGYDAWRREQNA